MSLRTIAALFVGGALAAGCAAKTGGGASQRTSGVASADGGAAGDSSGVASADAGATTSAGDGGAVFIEPTGQDADRAAQFFRDGASAYARGDFPAAAEAFRQLHQLYPSPDMAFNLARVYERMGETTESLRFYQIVLAANPEPARKADIEKRMAAIRAYEQRRRDGISVPAASQDALSQEGRTWFERGLGFFRRRRYREALLAFEQAYQYLQTADLYFNLAVTHERLGNKDRALEFYRDYLQQRQTAGDMTEVEQAEINKRIEALQQ